MRKQRVSIPSLATIVGVRVGYDTIPTIEHLLGPGLPVTGGHPHGARLWRVRGTAWNIVADGFTSYAKNAVPYTGGRVIDFVQVTHSDKRGTDAPFARLPHHEFGFMGKVLPGMTKAEVLHTLRGTLPPPKVQGEQFLWEANGYNALNDQRADDKTRWLATLTFQNGQLSTIFVDS